MAVGICLCGKLPDLARWAASRTDVSSSPPSSSSPAQAFVGRCRICGVRCPPPSAAAGGSGRFSTASNAVSGPSGLYGMAGASGCETGGLGKGSNWRPSCTGFASSAGLPSSCGCLASRSSGEPIRKLSLYSKGKKQAPIVMAAGGRQEAVAPGATPSAPKAAPKKTNGTVTPEERARLEAWRRVHPMYMRGESNDTTYGIKNSEATTEKANRFWDVIVKEARKDANMEPILSSFLHSSILEHRSFEESLAFILANRLANQVLLAPQLYEVFLNVLTTNEYVRTAATADVEAVFERDPGCYTYCHALLYRNGFHAVESYRIAHELHKRGSTFMALTLQSRITEVFGVDIHPAAQIGKGILIDGMGVVIGETAVIGDNVSILQGVTLGGTGKETGDRHPKLGSDVLIGAQATILGNISVGRGAIVAAGSLVLGAVPPNTIVAGIPAKVVGEVNEPVPEIHHKNSINQDFCRLWETAVEAQKKREAMMFKNEPGPDELGDGGGL